MSDAGVGPEPQEPAPMDQDSLGCPEPAVPNQVVNHSKTPIYSQYLDIMKEFKSQAIDMPGLIAKVSSLFGNHDIALLVDILVQYDFQTSVIQEDRDHFVTTTKALVESGIIPVKLAVERFDMDTYQKLGIDGIAQKQYNILRTRLFYKQKKYNLLREENEGFAKVIAELFHLATGNCEEILKNVKDIIGKYLVDPNRVLDLFLEVFEFHCNRDSTPYIQFLKSFYDSPDKVLQVIALKLSFYGKLDDDSSGLAGTEGQILPLIPNSLYRLIAVLIHEEIFEIDDIYPYLAPVDEQILEYHKKLVDEAKAFSRRYAMAVVGEEKPVVSVRDSLSDKERYILEVDNQKINICAHLIDIGDWEQAVDMSKRMPEYYCFSHQRVASSACDFINYLIDPIYRERVPLPKPVKVIPKRDDGQSQIISPDDVEKALLPMLITLGPFIHYNTLVLTKVIRVLKHLVAQERTEDGQTITTLDTSLYYSIIDVISESILPALSFSGPNCCLAREIWALLRNFKYHIRYKLYYSTRDDGSNPLFLRNRGQILLKAKHHMKRLSKETQRLSGRLLGKLCCSNPVIVLNYILLQIQSFDNLISMVVDAMRYMTPLAIDALMYCIIEALSDPKKDKKSFDGMALAPWLTNLSSFSANVLSRYRVEMTAFLEYIAHQLKAGSSLDLVLLTDVIQKMTGIETIQAISDDRIEALMGGDVLRTEGAYFNQVKNTRKSSARLKEALLESRLAIPLCISMVQLRDSLFFDQQEDNPLKLIGKLYDQCQETFVQYGVFLSMNLKIDDYMNFLPSPDKLMMDYKFDPDSAFYLARPMIFHKIKSKFLELTEAALKEVQTEEGEAPEISHQTKGIKFVEAAKSVIDPLAKAIQPSLTEKYGTANLNCKLFVIFWTLSMSDIEVPVDCYNREISRLRKVVETLGTIDDDPKKTQRKERERERYSNLIQKLKQEQAEQLEFASYIRMYLESERTNLFRERSTYDHVYLESRQFVQHCPYSRSILTAYDAIYSARFLLFLHELKVEDYPTIICFDRLLCDITYMMGACTENEANHYGRFLNQILKITALWHSDSKIYNEQCEQYPGSIINVENAEHITYENFRDICYKWHYRLTRAFTVALESNNYVLIRNALIVMISIIEFYPAIKHFGKGIGMKIEEVRNNEKESRQDLYALATAYAGKLDEKKPTLIPEANFHFVDDRTPNSHRERHSSSSSRKKARHN